MIYLNPKERLPRKQNNYISKFETAYSPIFNRYFPSKFNGFAKQDCQHITQQLEQISSALYAPIRSGDDGMITTEATDVNEFADLIYQLFDDGLDCLATFPNHGALLDACQEKEASFQEKNEMEPSQLSNK